MASHIVELFEIIPRTHNVRTYRVTKPSGFNFVPGQATDFSLHKSGWENEKRPFTFTCLPEDDYLEFTIKSYHDHDGVTHQLSLALPGDEFEISDAWGAISYRGEGTFIAGGAGVTPFISIFRSLKRKNAIGNNKLYFSNKTEADIILRDEFDKMLAKNFINIITEQPNTNFYKGRIDAGFLKDQIKNTKQQFYVCGPDPFNAAILKFLEDLGAHPESLVFEK
ncbi:MAG: flavodoxin reductase [Bacteroidetes bacterium]|nr:MAG: flavodoxin reductase [Bacteroidota bacterium]